MSNKRKHGRPLRLLLADDHQILVDILRRQLEASGQLSVVGAAGGVQEAVELVRKEKPDVVLLDIDMNGQSGLDAIAPMRSAHADLRIVMLSMYDQELFRSQCFERGADAFVTKGAHFEQLRSAIFGLAPTPTQGKPMVWVRPAGGRRIHATLTDREIQVLRGLVAGRREKELADELSISVSSIGTYLKRAMVKMSVKNRAELMKQAGALGVAPAGAEPS